MSKLYDDLRVEGGNRSLATPQVGTDKSIDVGKYAEMLAKCDDKDGNFLRENLGKDINEFILSNIENSFAHPMDNAALCYTITEKVCDYYGIDKFQFNMGLSEKGMADSMIADINWAIDRANEVLRTSIDNWNSDKNAPRWRDLKNTMTNDQMISTINILATTNRGKLPSPIGMDESYFYYALYNSNEIARISKKRGGKMDVTSIDFEYVTNKSFEQYVRGQSEPLAAYKSAFKDNPTKRQYVLRKDGSAVERVKDIINGDTRKYKISKPEIKFYLSRGVVLENSYYEKITSNHETTSTHTAEGSFAFFSTIKEWTNNVGTVEEASDHAIKIRVDKLPANAGIEMVSHKGSFHETAVKGEIYGMNVKAGYDASKKRRIVGLELKGNVVDLSLEREKTSTVSGVKGEVGARYGLVKGEVSLTGESLQYDDGMERVTKGWEVSGTLGNELINASLSFGKEHSYDLRTISNNDNGYVNELPADIIGELYNEKLEELNTGDKIYYLDDILGFPIKDLPVQQEEIDALEKNVQTMIENATGKDFQYPKSDFNGFQSCYAVDY